MGVVADPTMQVFDSALQTVQEYLDQKQYECARKVVDNLSRLKGTYPEVWHATLVYFPDNVRQYVRYLEGH